MKTNKLILALLNMAMLFSALPVMAAEYRTPLIPVSRDFTLPNGLRVVFSEDHSVPVVAVAIVYDVGARNEQKGKSGFAHLFEHMMFEGSENVAKNQFMGIVEAAGGMTNASTHSDFTNYFEKVPSNQLETALWLESDRMRSLAVTDKNFKNKLETVKEEKRMRIDNQPYSPAALRFDELLFDNWTNAHPVIGSFEDLEASSVADVRRFFDTYYVPNNAVIAIVGDIDSNKAEALVRKYFATIAKGPKPPKPDVAEPTQAKAKYEKMDDKLAKMPAILMGWKAPPARDPDSYTVSIMQRILTGGESSRLYQRMVKGDQVALEASMGVDERRGPSALDATIVYKPGTTSQQAQDILWSELEKIKTTPVTDKELETAKNQILRTLFASGSYSSLQRCVGRAEILAENTLFYGNPNILDEDVQRYLNVTAADIQRVAKKIFTKEGTTIMDIVPVEKAEAKQKAQAGNQI